jgi:predicted GNAT superfamily acetyltransferase
MDVLNVKKDVAMSSNSLYFSKGNHYPVVDYYREEEKYFVVTFDNQNHQHFISLDTAFFREHFVLIKNAN